MVPRSESRPTWRRILWQTLRRRLVLAAIWLALILSGLLDPVRDIALANLRPMAEQFVVEYRAYREGKGATAQPAPETPDCTKTDRGTTGRIVFHRAGGCVE